MSRRPYQRIILFTQLNSASRGHPYSRGRGSGPVSRHRTLIVNQLRPTDDSTQIPTTTNSQWIQKRDRHMQLINASVYEERAQARQNEINETKKQRLLDRQAKRDKLERTKLYGFLKKKGQGNQVSVCGILYRVTAQGNKLVKFHGRMQRTWLIVDNTGGSITPPRRIKIGGVAFYRSKNGNYWRRGVVAASKSKFLSYSRRLTSDLRTRKTNYANILRRLVFRRLSDPNCRILCERTIMSIHPRPR